MLNLHKFGGKRREVKIKQSVLSLICKIFVFFYAIKVLNVSFLHLWYPIVIDSKVCLWSWSKWGSLKHLLTNLRLPEEELLSRMHSFFIICVLYPNSFLLLSSPFSMIPSQLTTLPYLWKCVWVREKYI